MTINETVTVAIRKAHRRVSIVPQGRDYVVHCWSPRHNATHVSHAMDIWRAKSAAYEAKIRTALELLGVEDAGEIANIAAEGHGQGGTPDWRSVVRKHALLKPELP